MAEVARLLAAAKKPALKLMRLIHNLPWVLPLTNPGKFFRLQCGELLLRFNCVCGAVAAFAAVTGGSRELVGIALVADMPAPPLPCGPAGRF